VENSGKVIFSRPSADAPWIGALGILLDMESSDLMATISSRSLLSFWRDFYFWKKVGRFPNISLEMVVYPVHKQSQEAGSTLGRTIRPKIKSQRQVHQAPKSKEEMFPARGATYVSPKAAREVGRPAMGQTADPAVAAAGFAVFCFTPSDGLKGGAQRRGDRDVQGRTLPEGRFQGPRDAARTLSSCL
jgi:hypothetical protein